MKGSLGVSPHFDEGFGECLGFRDVRFRCGFSRLAGGVGV